MATKSTVGVPSRKTRGSTNHMETENTTNGIEMTGNEDQDINFLGEAIAGFVFIVMMLLNI